MIRIVIDIPKSFYKKIIDDHFFVSISDFDLFCKAVKNGTPLSEYRCHKIETETEGYQHQVSDFVEGVKENEQTE